MMQPLDLLILTLATWRIAALVSKEDAPFRVMKRIRDRLPEASGIRCVMCVSIWAAALVLVLWQTPLSFLVTVAAVSGGALMLARYTGVDFGSRQ